MKTRNSVRSSASNPDPESVSDLYSLANYEKRGIKDLGFSEERFLLLKNLFNLISPDHNEKPLIIVAGTKGKGSTCRFLYNILRKGYKRIGLFTSPHILKINERIEINNRPIANSEFDRLYNSIKSSFMDFSQQYPSFSPSTFEILTIMAKIHFDEKATDLDIFEIGLGGRYDAVNCLNDKRIAVITSISLDHTNILGNTLGQIFLEKLQIAREGQPLFIGHQKHLDIDAYKDILKDFRPEHYGRSFYYEHSSKCIRFFYNNDHYKALKPCRHYPDFHLENLSLAFAVASFIDEKIIEQNRFCLKDFNTACRFELIQKGCSYFLLDAAHNKASLQSLFDNIERIWPSRKKILIFGCLKDKDIEGMIKVILDFNPFLTIFQKPESERAYDFKSSGVLKSDLFSYIFKDNPPEAYEYLHERDLCRDCLIIITGSFYLCADYKQYLSKETIEKEKG